MDRFLRYWAAASVIAQFDAFPYSMPGDDYYVYVDPGTHRLAFLPWGMDETFYSGSVDVTNVYSVLARRCKESAACWQSYQAQVWQVQAITESMDLAGERDRVIAQIAPHVAADTRKPYTQEQVTESQGALYWFIHERRMKLNAMFAPPPPPPGNP
jgi:spore coat protein CotH